MAPAHGGAETRTLTGSGAEMNESQSSSVAGGGTHRPSGGVGLCLSGGGYRAMLFHVGTLRRLNETGWLKKITRVSSVSGGSIVAATLGKAWQDLAFGKDGVSSSFFNL